MTISSISSPFSTPQSQLTQPVEPSAPRAEHRSTGRAVIGESLWAEVTRTGDSAVLTDPASDMRSPFRRRLVSEFEQVAFDRDQAPMSRYETLRELATVRMAILSPRHAGAA
jgi:hypothetical protein